MPGDTAPHVVEDFLGLVQLLSDGSVVRGDEAVLGPKEPFPDVPGVEWKDVVYHAAHGLRVRVYRPASSSVAGSGKLPVMVYFPGGGYCLGSFAQPTFHTFCLRAAAELPAVVLSVQYRLAPEHRLPAAIDDGAAFLSWLRGQAELGAGADPWLAESACFTRTFVSGVSAGANLAHHVTVQVASARLPVSPVRVVGYVLLSAFFGGARRTAAETDPTTDVSLPVEMSEQLWHMSLPVGASRDHPVANPFGPESPSLTSVDLPPALVVAPLGDVLRDRVLGYAARLKDMGKAVEVVQFEGEQHGFSVIQPFGEAADELMRVLRRFVYQDLHGQGPARSKAPSARSHGPSSSQAPKQSSGAKNKRKATSNLKTPEAKRRTPNSTSNTTRGNTINVHGVVVGSQSSSNVNVSSGSGAARGSNDLGTGTKKKYARFRRLLGFQDNV